MDALRRQDWAAVTIEFTLVVVGVLLAFQSMNGHRTGRRGTSAKLLRLDFLKKLKTMSRTLEMKSSSTGAPSAT
jgi:hypothetical protein